MWAMSQLGPNMSQRWETRISETQTIISWYVQPFLYAIGPTGAYRERGWEDKQSLAAGKKITQALSY
jgi:hypothetical protein